MKAALTMLAEFAPQILGLPLTAPQTAHLTNYLNILMKWQKTQRLVGSSDPHWIVEHVLLDSLLFLRVLPSEIRSLADVGSGAGVPGVPLAIVRPDVRVMLIESRERRVSFLSAVVREVPLANARVVSGRIETITAESDERVDAVVMRCTGDFAELARAASALVVPGGVVIASGPPKTRARSFGEWAEVPGTRPGSRRRFVVHRP